MDNITKNRIILSLSIFVILFVIVGVIYISSDVFKNFVDVKVFKKEIVVVATSTANLSESTSTDPVVEDKFVGKKNAIEIFNLKEDDSISNPLIIIGKAKLWYFEGSFPVEIFDSNGQSLGAGVATAQSDWMVTDFVDFKVTLSFATTTSATGTIVFKKDNPSGDPIRDESFVLPIRFSPSN